MIPPRDVVDRQLQAYNAHQLEAFCALFADDAVVIDLATGTRIAEGLAAISALYRARFRDYPNLRCTVHEKMDLADFAIDRETVTGHPGGPTDIIAIYEVREGLIRAVRFIRQQAP